MAFFVSSGSHGQKDRDRAMSESSKTDAKVILALSLVHFIGDFYVSFVSPLFPVFVERFSLTLAQVGLIAGVSRFLAFIVQPSAGYIADHYQTRFFVLGGPLLAIVFIPLVGVAPCFLVLLLFVSLGSIGSSLFHPTCAGMVSDYAGRHLGFSMSIFNLGGTVAFALGPLFITRIVESYGLQVSPFTMILGLAVMVVLIRIVPLPAGEELKDLGFIESLRQVLGQVWKSIAIIWIVMVLRSFVGQSFWTFMPVLFSQEGLSLASIGLIISLLTMAGALSGLVAGHVSDRIGYKPVFYLTHALTTPCLLMLLYLPSRWVYVSASLAGFFVMATLPLGVAMAQELAPKGRSMVSSLMMGLAFGAGGMMTPLTGQLADLYSIRTVLSVIAFIPLPTIAIIALLPGRKPGSPAAAIP